MSRSSAGFADFFPTAPSVLQQKRFKLTRERPQPQPQSGNEKCEEELACNAAPRGNICSTKEEISSDAIQKHCANSGKASSETTKERTARPAINGVSSCSASAPRGSATSSHEVHLDTLTPLTNAELSSPHKPSSPQIKIPNGTAEEDTTCLKLEEQKSEIASLRTPPTPQSLTRRIGGIRGYKLIYDPDFEKRPSKEKRKKPRYLDIGFDEQTHCPSDPRLGISNYTRGAGCKQKTKFRPAPYTLKHWSYDASTSIGPGPPVQIVVTGFDPLTPIAPISALFSSFGEISEINNRTDPITGRFLGVCSIKYKDSESFRGGGPVLGANAAKRAYYECKKEQRIGTRRIRVELDRDGMVSDKIVSRAVDSQRIGYKGSLPIAEDTKVEPHGKNEPPPMAPKGPSGKLSIRPMATIPEGPRVSFLKPVVPSLVEDIPILNQIKRDPYIFIAHCYVPVLSTTVPHLKKRLKLFNWKDIRCDRTGYYIIFENSRRGEEETERCYKMCHMKPLFTYIMNMESQPYGNPGYERSPSPERFQAEQRERAEKERLRKEASLDDEEEKKQRALDLDPCKEVLAIIIRDLKDKLLEDVKSRIAAPALYDYLDPDRHAPTRKKLGIADPEGTRMPLFRIDFDNRLGTPDSRSGLSQAGRPFNTSSLNLHDDDDSDDEQRTPFAKDTDEQDSRPPSRMSSRASDTDDGDEFVSTSLQSSLANNLTHKVRSSELEDKDDVLPDGPFSGSTQHCIPELSPASHKRKRLGEELKARKRQKEDEELFGISPTIEIEDERIRERSTSREATDKDVVAGDISSLQSLSAQDGKNQQKKTFQQRSGLENLQGIDTDSPVIRDGHHVMLNSLEEVDNTELRDISKTQVKWRVSDDEPRPIVDDDDAIIMDLDGWQTLIKDEEDLHFLREILVEQQKTIVGNLSAWAWRQKEIKALNRPGNIGPVHEDIVIHGYYVSNATGAARTEGRKKILESEKSKYLPHRIKVQKAREEREAKAKNDPHTVAAEAARVAAAKTISKSTSRSTRVNNRRLIADINAQKQALPTQNGDGDVLRFNQLKKRKKPVRFARCHKKRGHR
ncbi:hypothetical protein EYZ11_009614 [Aspergillus tanneri]|uniref:COMPASS complex Set1 subunit N-SET domain-containing protein n=1 Tax=Aspergillus tanneri TaxID=1220188 RepID=A0A4S3J7H0_9EURO|nr:hypothetical protein EYZ11_009614 [Aspergillus tanneri]